MKWEAYKKTPEFAEFQIKKIAQNAEQKKLDKKRKRRMPKDKNVRIFLVFSLELIWNCFVSWGSQKSSYCFLPLPCSNKTPSPKKLGSSFSTLGCFESVCEEVKLTMPENERNTVYEVSHPILARWCKGKRFLFLRLPLSQKKLVACGEDCLKKQKLFGNQRVKN